MTEWDPVGHDFAVKTPCTPSRWDDFEMEMTSAWEAICDAYCGENYGSTDFDVLENVREAILRLTYYCMTIRLKIVYGRLSIRSVRSAFEKSVGDRLQKFGVRILKNCCKGEGGKFSGGFDINVFERVHKTGNSSNSSEHSSVV